ncbi:TPA: hypothetical protein ACKP2D_004962, partial [Serratia marcescens]
RGGDAPPACADKRARRQRGQSQPAMHDLASDRLRSLKIITIAGGQRTTKTLPMMSRCREIRK